MDWALFLELAVNGALAGLMYSLVALGIVLIYKSSSVPNLAQGAMTMVGAYLVLEVGHVFAIEPMVNAGTQDVRVLEDLWTVVTADARRSAHFEHTVAVTEDGPQVLTLP